MIKTDKIFSIKVAIKAASTHKYYVSEYFFYNDNRRGGYKRNKEVNWSDTGIRMKSDKLYELREITGAKHLLDKEEFMLYMIKFSKIRKEKDYKGLLPYEEDREQSEQTGTQERDSKGDGS